MSLAGRHLVRIYVQVCLTLGPNHQDSLVPEGPRVLEVVTVFEVEPGFSLQVMRRKQTIER